MTTPKLPRRRRPARKGAKALPLMPLASLEQAPENPRLVPFPDGKRWTLAELRADKDAFDRIFLEYRSLPKCFTSDRYRALVDSLFLDYRHQPGALLVVDGGREPTSDPRPRMRRERLRALRGGRLHGPERADCVFPDHMQGVALGECDWGACDLPAVAFMYSPRAGWLPCCVACISKEQMAQEKREDGKR